MDSRKNGEMSLEEVRDVLESHYNKLYGGERIPRKLSVKKMSECIFFVLEGTPPKGFGIFVPSDRRLYLHDKEGKRFKDYYLQKGIVGLEK